MTEGRSGPAEAASRLLGWLASHRLATGLLIALALYTIAGFLLAPWLLKRELAAFAREGLGRELRIAEAAVNPFALSVRLAGVELRDTDGSRLLGLDEFLVDFELSSIVRRAWTFGEIRLAGPYARAVRESSGEINLARLVPPESGDEPAPPADAALPRVVVQRFELRDGRVDLEDHVPATPFATRLGPLEVTLEEVSTLPNAAGQQAIAVTTETGARLAWRGSLGLNPLQSVGELTLNGPHVPVVYRYLRDQLNFELAGGEVDFSARYRVAAAPEGGMTAAVDDLSWKLSGARFLDGASGTEFLSIPMLSLSGGTLRWPEQAVSVARIAVEGVRLAAALEADGSLDLARLFSPKGAASPAAPEPAGDAAAPAPAGRPWKLALAEFELSDLAAQFTDRTLATPAMLGIADLDFKARNVSNEPGARFDVEVRLGLGGGGTVRLAGAAGALPAPLLDAGLQVDGVKLAQAQPYVSEALRVEIRGGELALDGQLRSGEKEQFAFDGKVSITGFDAYDAVKKERLVGFAGLALEDVRLRLTERRLKIARLALNQPYGRVFIAEDKSTNVGDLVVEPPAGSAAAPPADAAEPPFAVRLGKAVIRGGSSDFTDLSLPLPFAAHITGLKGEITAMDSTSTAPSRVALEGQVNEYGYTSIQGQVSAAAPMDDTDLRVVFRNVEMPPLSPYTVDFAGHKIASGKLDLDLHYRFDQRQMNGDNRIVIDELELGEKVPHPDAMDLPLGLAIALLKDADGRIDIDMPVSGSLDDPQFGIGRVVMKALATLITKIVTSPFRLLGSLLGIESDELGQVSFPPGRAELLPPEREKLVNVTTALGKRPNLGVAIPAVMDPEADAAALRSAKLDASVEQLLASSGGKAPDRDLEARTRKVMEGLYAGAFPQQPLEALRERFTVAPPGEPQARPRLDELAYVEELRRQLVDAQAVTAADLEALAVARSDAIREALTADGAVAAERLKAGERKKVRSDDAAGVVAELEIVAAGS